MRRRDQQGSGVKHLTRFSTQEVLMAWDYIEGKWKEMRGKVRERWGKLTDDDLDVIAGKRDQLIGIIQQRYGLQKDEIERQVSEFERSSPATEDRAAR